MSSLEATLRPWLSYIMNEWLVYQTVGSVLAIFPSALLMGVAFPIGLRLWTSGGPDGSRRLAERIGVFYSLNVTGSILGSLAAGFLLLPHLGSRASLIALSTLSFGSGVALLAASGLAPDDPPRGRRRGDRSRSCWRCSARTTPSTSSCSSATEARNSSGEKKGSKRRRRCTSTNGGEISLTVNGNHQASTGRGMVNTHRAIGHLPMVLHPDAREALVIGLGGGATAGAVSIHTGVDVDVVELAGAVARGARYLDAINYGVLTRPNVHLRIDDGRNHLLVTERKYDVVTADVILPIYAGSGNLYSAEYFRLMRRVLKPGRHGAAVGRRHRRGIQDDRPDVPECLSGGHRVDERHASHRHGRAARDCAGATSSGSCRFPVAPRVRTISVRIPSTSCSRCIAPDPRNCARSSAPVPSSPTIVRSSNTSSASRAIAT